MHDIEAVDVLDAIDELVIEAAGILLPQLFAFDYEVEELSALNELHHEEQVLGRLYDFVELDDVRMADQFEDVDLPGYALHVGNVDDLFLFEDLYGDGLVSGLVRGQLHLSEGALPERPTEAVATDLFLGISCGFRRLLHRLKAVINKPNGSNRKGQRRF